MDGQSSREKRGKRETWKNWFTFTGSTAQSSKDLYHKEKQRNAAEAGEYMWLRFCFCIFSKMDDIIVYRTLMEKSSVCANKKKVDV